MSAGIRMNNLPTNPIAEVFGLSPDGTVSRQDIDLFIQALLQAAGAGPAGLPAEVLRAQAAERAARTLASPKIVLRNDPYTEFASGAQSDGNGGIRVPAGSRGAGSQIRARFNLSSADIAANAGRLVRFVSIYRVTPGFLTAFKDIGGNVTLFNVADGVQGGTTSATVIQADTIMVEMDAVLAGTELLPAQIFFIGGDTQPLAADAAARLIGTAWFPADATGTTDVLAKITQPLPSSIGELIAVATVRRALDSGAVPAFADRGMLIPAGQTGSGSLLIAGIPAQGLAAGVVVRVRFLFGASADIEPSTVLGAAGGTVSMASGPDVGGAGAALTKLATGVYEGTFTYTMVGGETRFEFFVAIGSASAARSTRGFVRLEQATLEIVSTPLTTTINGQVASYRAQTAARLAEVPDHRRVVGVAADGSSLDGVTRVRDAVTALAAAAGPHERAVASIGAGTYTDECAAGATPETSPAIAPADYVDIVGTGRPEDVRIIARFPDNQAGQDTIQPFRVQRTGRIANLTVIGRNLRYPIHMEAGNAPNRAVQVVEDVVAIHEGATGWASPTAIGVGQHEANDQTFRRVRARSPQGAIGIHDNINWSRPSRTLIEDSVLHGTGIDGRSLVLTSTGSGLVSPVVVRGSTLAGHVRLDCSFLPGALLANHKASRYGYSLTVYASSPIDVVGVCDVSALTLTSVAGASSAVAVSGPGAAVLFGAAPDVREGAADYAARVYSYHAVDIPAGEVDPGVTLAARLGNRSGSPLSLGVAWDGQQPVTVTLSADYRGMSNASIVSALNSALAAAMGGNAGGRAFSLSQPYNNRPPVHQPDREGRGLNVGSSTILHGMALAWSGHDVRVMTSTDATSLFAGIAIGDTIPGRPARFLRTGWIGQAQLRFDGTPSIQPGDRFQVSAASPGALVEGTDLPLLVVRSVEPHGACLEIIESVLFTGDTQQAVRDAFASITYRDVPGLSDAVDAKASRSANLSDLSNAGAARANLNAAQSGANSDITSLNGLTTPLSQAQGGSGAATLADASVTIPGISAPHILGDFLRYPISLERYGCRGDFDGSTGFDNANSLAKAIDSGDALVLPPGKRYLTGSPLTVTNRAIQIIGAHRSSAIVSPAGVPGMVVNQNSQDNATHISNVAFLTLGQESGTGLSVTYSVGDSGNFRNDVRCHIENVVCRGVDYLQHGWDIGIDLVDVHNLSLIRPNVVGRRNFNADAGGRLSFGTMTAGIRNTGTSLSSIPSDAMVFNPLVANAKIGIQSRGQVEGFRVIEPVLIAMWQCIDIANDSARPWGRVVGGHLSPIDLGIAVKNCPAFTARDILFIKGAPAGALRTGMYPSDIVTGTAGTVLIYLEGCNGFNISDMNFVNYATDYTAGGASIGIALKDSFQGNVEKIDHDKPTVGLYLIGTSGKVITSRYRATGSYSGSPVSEYLDRSTGGGNLRLDGNQPAGTASNASAITLSGTPDKSVSVFIPNAQAGQRYRFEAHVEAGISGAGEVNFSISNDGGGAGGAWDASAGYIAERRAAAAGSTQACSVSGIYTVTSRGSIVAKLSLQMPSGAGSVGAGKAQMSATLL